MNVTDVVVWADELDDCSRCGGPAPYYVAPYWARYKRVCPRCCVELNRLFDTYRWPD